MKYYKLDNQVFAFEKDGSQDDFISDDMIKMTSKEVDRHINPEKYLSDKEKQQSYIESLPALTRRQFKLALLNADLTAAIESAINAVTDDKTQAMLLIEYNESTQFIRTSDSVQYMCHLLNLSDAEINMIWEAASQL